MAPSDPEHAPAPETLDALRAFTAARVEATTAREVAREAGISPAGLRSFLAGGVPYAKTRKRLYDWWSGHHHHRLPALSSPAIAAVLEDLLGSVPPERRTATRNDLIATLRDLYAAHPRRCPPWVAELIRDSAAPQDPASSPPEPAGGAAPPDRIIEKEDS